MNSRPFDEWLTARCGPNISPDADHHMTTLATSWIHTNKGWIRSDQILLVRTASERRIDRMRHIVKLRAPSVSTVDIEMPDDYPTLDAAQAAAAKLVTAIATGRKGTDR